MSDIEITVKKVTERYIIKDGRYGIYVDIVYSSKSFSILAPQDDVFQFKNQTPGSCASRIAVLIEKGARLAEKLLNCEQEKIKC